MSRRLRFAFWLFLVAFLAHAPALMGVLPGALPSTGDTLGAFAPWHEFIRQNLHQGGTIPLWNPHLYCGVPFAGNGQSALFYPPTYLHFLLPENLALWLFALLHSWFLMLGGAFLGRTLGLSNRAAILLAMLLGLGNATPAHLFGGHLTFLAARTFWPWQAAFLLRILRGGNAANSPFDAVALAACLALGLAAGAPQIWLFGVLFCVAITALWIFRALQTRISPANWPWKSGILALLLTVLWCAPVLLPLRELKNWSSHGAMLSFAEVTGLSATLRSLFRLWFANFFGHNSSLGWSLPSNFSEDSASLGLVAGILALAAPFLLLKKGAPRKRLAGALWLGCALSLLLALGNSTPLYRFLYNHIGLFQITRVPARWLELWAFGVAILAAIAFDAALQNATVARRLKAICLIAAFACLCLAPVVWRLQAPWDFGARIVLRNFNFSPSEQLKTAATLRLDALLSCVFGALVLSAFGNLMRRGVGSDQNLRAARPIISSRHVALLLAIIGVEPLANFWLGINIATPWRVRQAQIPAPLLRKYRVGERWIVSAPFQQLNAPLSAQIDALNGYEPFGSAPFFAFAGAAQPGASFSADFQPVRMNPLWRVMGGSHVLWKPKFAGDEPRGFGGATLAQADDWRLNSIVDGLKPWPRAYLTRDLTRVEGENALESLQKIAAKPFQNAPPAVVPDSFPAFAEVPTKEIVDSLSLRPTVQTPDAREWQIGSDRAALFVENETLAPGWKAFVDAKPAKIYLANAIFRGVAVPDQSRKIALIYDSQTLRFGLFLALCGLGFAAFCMSVKR